MADEPSGRTGGGIALAVVERLILRVGEGIAALTYSENRPEAAVDAPVVISRKLPLVAASLGQMHFSQKVFESRIAAD